MALTSLESISEKLQEQRKNELESILRISGSAAISRNEYGVNVVDNSNVATSLIFKTLNKNNLDEAEILKAIDVTVVELKPDIPVVNKDLVPRPLFTEQVDLVTDLRKQVTILKNTVQTRDTRIIELVSQVQAEINNRLSIEQTNDILVNQIETLTSTIDDFASQIATSLQKSVEESILRASLQSQNTGFKAQIEALIQQINSLNAIIEGLQAQLGAVRQQKEIQATTQAQGGTVVNKVVSVDFAPKGTPSESTMYYKIKNARDDAKEWVRGETVKIQNNDLESVDVTITTSFTPNQVFFKVPKTNFTIAANAMESIQFIATPQSCSYGKRDNTVTHPGSISFTIKRKDGTTETKTFNTEVKIAHPKSY